MISLDLMDAYFKCCYMPSHRLFLVIHIEGSLQSPHQIPIQSSSVWVNQGSQALHQALGSNCVPFSILALLVLYPYTYDISMLRFW